MMVGAVTDPFGRMHMGVTAENVVAQFGISRADQDALAVESHRRAVRVDEGRFNDQIIPVVIKTRKGETKFMVDEHPRRDMLPLLEGPRRVAPRLREGKRDRHGWQCIRYQRRLGRCPADERRSPQIQWLQAAGSPWSPMRTLASIPKSWVSARFRPHGLRCNAPA